MYKEKFGWSISQAKTTAGSDWQSVSNKKSTGIRIKWTGNHLIGETAICYGLSPVIKWLAW